MEKNCWCSKYNCYCNICYNQLINEHSNYFKLDYNDTVYIAKSINKKRKTLVMGKLYKIYMYTQYTNCSKFNTINDATVNYKNFTSNELNKLVMYIIKSDDNKLYKRKINEVFKNKDDCLNFINQYNNHTNILPDYNERVIINGIKFKRHYLELLCPSRDKYSLSIYGPTYGFVYIIVCDDIIKIGSSQTPNQRILSQIYKHKNLFKTSIYSDNENRTHRIQKVYISECVKRYTNIEYQLCHTLQKYRYTDTCREVFKLNFDDFARELNIQFDAQDLNDNIELKQLNILNELKQFLNSDLAIKHNIYGIYMCKDNKSIKSNWIYNKIK